MHAAATGSSSTCSALGTDGYLQHVGDELGRHTVVAISHCGCAHRQHLHSVYTMHTHMRWVICSCVDADALLTVHCVQLHLLL